MAISAIQPVSGFSQVAAVGALQVRRRVALVEQAPQIALPGVTVTLGASQSLPALYNSAGLLRSLIQVEATNDLPSGPLPGSDEARLQGELGVLLRLNTDTANSGIFSATGSTVTLSADTLQALNNVLANRLGDAGSSARSQAESDLLAQLLSASSSGLSSATAGAAVLNASGVLRGATADTSSKAVDSLLTIDLGLAARALDANSAKAAALATPSLLQNSQSSSTGFALGSILATNVNLAAAASNVSSLSLANLDTGTSSAVKDNILRSSLNLSGESGGLLAGGNLLDAGSTLALPTSITPEPMTRVLTALLREGLADEQTPVIDLGAAAVVAPAGAANDTQPATGVVLTPTDSTPAAPTDSILATPADSAGTELPGPINDPAATAVTTTTRNPAYAEAAAALYLSAAIYRSQPLPGDVSPPDELADTPAVSGIRQVLRLKAQ
jgi:hypothetical protein